MRSSVEILDGNVSLRGHRRGTVEHGANLSGQPVIFSLQNERGDLTPPSHHAHTIMLRE